MSTPSAPTNPPAVPDISENLPTRINRTQQSFNAVASAWYNSLPNWQAGLQALAAWQKNCGDLTYQHAGVAQQAVTDAQQEVSNAAQQVALASQQADRAEVAANNAASVANFLGDWNTLSGALTIPASTFWDGTFWVLTRNISSAQSERPGLSSAWRSTIQSSVDVGEIVYSFGDLSTTGLFVKPGMTYLQSAYPELFAILGKGLAAPTQKMANPSTLPMSHGRGADFSPDGNYLAIAHFSSPGVRVYQRSGHSYTTLVNISGFIPHGAEVGFSHDGQYLAVVGSGMKMYRKSGASFIQHSFNAPSGNVSAVDFSDNGYLALGISGHPYLNIYKRNGSNFDKLPDISESLFSEVKGLCFSPGGDYLAVANSAAPRLRIFRRNGSGYSQISGTPSLASNAWCVAFSHDGLVLAVGIHEAPYLALFRRSGDSFYPLTGIQSPAGTVNGVDFSGDGNYLAVGHTASPYITLYKRNGYSFTKLNGPSQLPSAECIGVKFSPNSMHLAVAHTTSPFMAIYKGDYPFDPQSEFYVPQVNDLTNQNVGGWAPSSQGKAYVRAK